MKFVLNVEKFLDGTKQQFIISSCRVKCLGGNGRFVPVMTGLFDKSINTLKLEQQIDTLIREISEEWSLNYIKLIDLFDNEKITLLDKNHKKISVYRSRHVNTNITKDGVINIDDETIRLDHEEFVSKGLDEDHITLQRSESLKDDEYLFVCKFDISDSDLVELYKPNEEIPRSVGGRQYRSYWRKILTHIFKL
jgi:hypothetical protein